MNYGQTRFREIWVQDAFRMEILYCTRPLVHIPHAIYMLYTCYIQYHVIIDCVKQGQTGLFQLIFKNFRTSEFNIHHPSYAYVHIRFGKQFTPALSTWFPGNAVDKNASRCFCDVRDTVWWHWVFVCGSCRGCLIITSPVAVRVLTLHTSLFINCPDDNLINIRK